MGKGAGVMDLDANSKAASEIQKMTEEVSDILEQTPAVA
jgi:hypothetical protein